MKNANPVFSGINWRAKLSALKKLSKIKFRLTEKPVDAKN